MAEKEQALAKMKEQLLLREAKDYVNIKLAESGLPEVTKDRLNRELAGNPPAKDGVLDQEKLDEAIEAAVKEAEAEVQLILGANGKILGMGEGANGDGVKLEESEERIKKALEEIGF